MSELSSSPTWGPYHYNGNEYSVYACPHCESLSTYPNPSDAALKKLYSESFAYSWYKDHYPIKLKDASQRVTEYKKFLGSSVLDYGGGVGYFSDACQKNGIHSKTHDPFAQNNSIDTKEKWTSIVALHMLEHSNNLDATIEDMKKRLLPNGSLILAVPNASGEGYKKYGSSWVWSQPPLIHIHHFTTKGIISLLERHGFKVIQVKTKDRWDANTVSDVYLTPIFKLTDRFWRPNYPAFLRKIAAKISAQLRLLAYTFGPKSSEESTLAEIEIVAKLQQL